MSMENVKEPRVAETSEMYAFLQDYLNALILIAVIHIFVI